MESCMIQSLNHCLNSFAGPVPHVISQLQESSSSHSAQTSGADIIRSLFQKEEEESDDDESSPSDVRTSRHGCI